MTATPKWTAESTTTTAGRVGMVICWYFDGDMESESDDCEIAANLIRLLPCIVQGHIRKLDDFDLFCLWDALGSYPERDEALEGIYQKTVTERAKRCKKRTAA